jgi:uncharacterized protein (TIGR03437 family)
MRTKILVGLAMLAKLAGAAAFTFVPIPANNNIQTHLYSTFPTGTFVADNPLATPFSIPATPGNCGASGASPCNFYDGFTGSGASITIDVSVANPADVYTLMNAYSPPPGQQIATIQFVGTGGASLTFPLIAGQNIRDYYQGTFANTLNNGITGVQAFNAFSCTDPTTCLDGTGGIGNLVADEQDFSLGTTFAGKTLTQIIITDTYSGSTPILLGVTVGPASPPPAVTFVPIPASNNIQTHLYSTFPTGTFVADNPLATPFSIPATPGNCGASGASPCNFYDGFTGSGASITIDVSIASPTDVYTLMNAYSPPPGQQIATIQFVGTGGASLTFPLIAGQDIRDYYQGIYANTLTNGITGVQAFNAFSCNDPATCLDGTGGIGNLVADEQDFSFGATFAGKTLTQIIITDTYSGSTPILLGISVAAPPTTTTFVPIPATNNIQTALVSTFPTGTFTAHNALGTRFGIRSAPGKCGPSGASPCNYYDGFTGSGKSITMDVSIANATDVYTLMNAHNPPKGQQLATVEFVGSGGASLTFPLIAGQDLRDFYHGSFANGLTNGITGVEAVNAFSCTDPAACLGSQGTGNVQTGDKGEYVVDEQHFSLGATFLGQTLTQIVITDTYGSRNQRPILLGVTVRSEGNGAPAIDSGGVVGGAGFQAGIVPGSWITIQGTNLSSKTESWNNATAHGNLPTSLDGVSVSIGGKPAYIAYISPTQINAVAPNVAAGLVPVTVMNASGASAPISAVMQAIQPSFFQWGNYAVATRQDYSLAVEDGTIPGVTTTPVKPGEVIILWGTGFGPTSPSAPEGVPVPSDATYNTSNTVAVTVGGTAATVYGAALAPGFTGLYQVAIQVPASLANGDYPVIATISGAQSLSTTLITVQN